MPSVLENTLICSYKGVQLHVDRISATSGRSKANYLYLNSGRRVSKDLGQFPNVFRVEGFTYSTDGDEYASKRDAMRSILDSPLDGEFVHPFAGNFWCSHGTYTWEEDFGRINECRFSFTLEQVSKDGSNPLTPTGELFNKSQIKKLALDTNRALQSACSDAFSATTSINKGSAASLIGKVGSKLKDTFGSVGETLSKANDYADKALDIAENAAYYANNPRAAFAAMADGILGIDGLTNSIYAKFRTVQNMFNFGDDNTDSGFAITSPTRISETPTTWEDAERTKNAKLVRTFMQSAATVQAFSTAGTSDPETTEEIDDFIEVLETQFRTISGQLTNDDTATTKNLGTSQPDFGSAYESLLELRSSVYGYLTQKRANAAYVKTITVEPMPCSELSYRLYGTSDRMDEIMKLNGLTDCFNVYGELKVLSK